MPRDIEAGDTLASESVAASLRGLRVAWRAALASALALLAFAAMLLPSYGHGEVDQQYAGDAHSQFTIETPLIDSPGQSFTPTQSTLVAVDLLLSTSGAVVPSDIPLTVTIRADSYSGTAVGVGSGTVTAGSNGIPSAPFAVHFDMQGNVLLVPDQLYVITVEAAAGLYWVVNPRTPYTDGKAYFFGNPNSGFDRGFRTYYGGTIEDTDSTPPNITYELDPPTPDGSNGWYRGDVELTWIVTDEESTASVTAGCEDQSITEDQAEQLYSCSATSEGGEAGPVSVAIKRDGTGPTIVASIEGDPPGMSGWYTSDVTITFDCDDNLSGILEGTCPEDEVLDSEGASVTSGVHTVVDAAGNTSASSETFNVSIDKTPPEVTITAQRETDHNGWYNAPVTFTPAGSDEGGSGLAGCDEAVEYAGPDSGIAEVTLHCTDGAGNVGSATISFKYDATDPDMDWHASAEPNEDGWIGSAIEVTFSGTDETSGGVTCDGPSTLAEDGGGQSVEGECTDAAGNVASRTAGPFNIDTTPPQLTYSVSGEHGSGTWYIGAVTIGFECGDDTSGVDVDEVPDITLDEDGGGQSVVSTGTCTNNAGGTAEAITVPGIDIDRTPPAVTIEPDREPDTVEGAYDHAVTFTASGEDGTTGSGVASCDADETYAGPIAGTASVTMSCTDNAGNAGSATYDFAYVDSTPPVITWELIPTRVPDGGWYTSDVTLTWRVDEPESLESLVRDGCEDQHVTEDRPFATYSCGASSLGGSVSVAEVSFGRDATKPVISATLLGEEGADGWYRGEVRVAFTCFDGVGSGVVTDTVPDIPVNTEGGQSVTSTGACTDTAGNLADPLTVVVEIDNTPPEVSASLSPAPNEAGWNNSDVTVTFLGVDVLSGGVTCDPPVVLTSEGMGQSATGSCSDAAGNSTSVTVDGINIDKTGPAATLAVTSGTPGVEGWYTSAVTLGTTGGDDLSEPVTCTEDQVQATDTAEQTFTGSCTNAAGLTTQAASVTVNVDQTPPALDPALSVDEAWLHGFTSIVANATDATSGVASSSCGAIDTSTVGVHEVTCVATDHAGNTGSATIEYEVLEIEGRILFGTLPPVAGGFGTFSFGGGTLDQLVAASGCPQDTSVYFWNKPSGTFAVWIPGSQVLAVNAEFLAMFPGSPPLPEGVLFTARCV